MSQRKRKGIRSLVRTEGVPTTKSRKRIKLFSFVAALVSFIIFLWKNENFRDELKHLAMNQFQMYLHGREDYCEEPFEHWHISNPLSNRIIGQAAALSEIESALQQHKNSTSIALIGTPGVGKTLTLHLIQQNFQWHLNIQHYIWSLIETPDNQLKNLLKLIDGLTTCGQNEIFIDNIPIQHINIIDRFNQKLLKFSNEKRIKSIVFYVFQAKRVIEANDPILQIDGVTWIHYRQFDLDDIRNCINMESDRLKLTVTPGQIDDLLENIHAKRFGCKSIAAKIARQDLNEL